MAEANWTTRLGATPGKLALVALLAVVFVYVLAVQFGGSDDVATASRRRNNRRRPRERVANNTANTMETKSAIADGRRERSDWPSFDRDTVAHHDPFRYPVVLADGVASAPGARLSAEGRDGVELERVRHERLARLEEQGVHVIVLGDGANSATIGDRTINVGDVIDGFQVAEIRRDGIFLVDTYSEFPEQRVD